MSIGDGNDVTEFVVAVATVTFEIGLNVVLFSIVVRAEVVAIDVVICKCVVVDSINAVVELATEASVVIVVGVFVVNDD